jgi:raffinose/stachyose/melibiose transport system permease protein
VNVVPARSVRISAHAALIIVGFISVIPLAWVWAQSLRTNRQISLNPIGINWPLNLQNYVEAWNQANFSGYLLNSVIVAVATVALVIAVAFPTAFALALLPLPARRIVFMVFLLGLMIPEWSIIIPLFFQLRSIGLLNTLGGVVLVEAALGLPFAVFLLRSSLLSMPRELIEAARIDGAGNLRTMWSVVLPIAKPALQAVIIFQFMASWNELVVPLFFLQSDVVRTLPIGLTFFQGRFGTDVATLAAGTTIASLPVLIVYIILNRRFIEGLTAGASK